MPVALLYWSKARLVLNTLWKKTHHVSKKKNANSFLCMQRKEEKETQIWRTYLALGASGVVLGSP
jgi:hypothetical protein